MSVDLDAELRASVLLLEITQDDEVRGELLKRALIRIIWAYETKIKELERELELARMGHD